MAVSALHLIAIVNVLTGHVLCLTCQLSDWKASFDYEGLSTCNSLNNEYISGFYRSSLGNPDSIDRLDNAQCCQVPAVYKNTPKLVRYADWSGTMSKNNSWSMCPYGFFLSGIYRSSGALAKLNSIKKARCVKPGPHPYIYDSCYFENINTTFENQNLVSCKDDFLVTGLFRGLCDQLKCIDQLKCCKMVAKPVDMDSLFAVTNRVMDVTLQPLATLASYLGYSGCLGCRAILDGEDFVRDVDGWRADTNVDCGASKATERLKIIYADWKFDLADVKYDNPQTDENLDPGVIDTGSFSNNGPTDYSLTISRTVEVTHTLRHTKTSTWKRSTDLYLEFTSWDSSSLFKFHYENGDVSDLLNEESHLNVFKVETTKLIPANSTCQWNLMLSKSRATINYTATISTQFSVEFQGYLKYGGGYYSKDANYHFDYRGKDTKTAYNYRFGNSDVPFYTDLKTESRQGVYPWMWGDVVTAYDDAQVYIDNLSNEANYNFPLTGKFEDISGKNVFIQWTCKTNPRAKRSADGDGVVTEVISGSVTSANDRTIKVKA